MGQIKLIIRSCNNIFLKEDIIFLKREKSYYSCFSLFYNLNLYNEYIMLPIIVAILAPLINSIQLFPQLYKTYKTKSVKDLSFYFLILLLISNFLWLLHGYFIFDKSLIVAGIVSIIINIVLLKLYFIYKK